VTAAGTGTHAGFRIDSAHSLYHDAELRDDPPAPGGGRLHAPHGLEQAYSANRPETHGMFQEWRKIADSHAPPRLLLGETWVGHPNRMAAYHGSGDELQLTFNFPFIFADFTAPALSRVVAETLAALPAGECPVWTASNHDISRFPSRWCGGDERKARLALLVLATLPGTLILYYGDEIAVTDLAVPAALRRDKMTAGDEGRDHARTPMHWNASGAVGFTAGGVRPWLPIGDDATRNVAAQREDPASMLSLCRALIALRSAEFGGRIASYQQLPTLRDVWAYQVDGLVVTANFSDRPAQLNSGPGPVVASSAGAPAAGHSPPGQASSPGDSCHQRNTASLAPARRVASLPISGPPDRGAHCWVPSMTFSSQLMTAGAAPPGGQPG
jgi:alpha-glucosidase